MPNPNWCVPPISTNTGPWDSGRAVDSRWSHTRSCRDWTCRGDSAPFCGRRKCLPNREEDPPHSSGARCSEPPAPMHNANATADVSTRNGTSAGFGQRNDCQDRDDTERTRPVTAPSVPPPHYLRPFSSHLNTPTPPTTHRLRTSATMSSFSGTHLRFFPSGRHRRSLWISSNIIALNSS